LLPVRVPSSFQAKPPAYPEQGTVARQNGHCQTFLSADFHDSTPEGRLAMGPVIAVGLRAAFGLLVAMFLSVLGFYAGWFSSPPGPNLPASMLIIGAGLGAAIGGFMAWIKPESPRYVGWVHLVLVLTGGLAGAWVGWKLGPIIYPEGLWRPGGSIYNAPPFYVAIVGASIGANLLAFVFYSFRLWRYREV